MEVGLNTLHRTWPDWTGGARVLWRITVAARGGGYGFRNTQRGGQSAHNDTKRSWLTRSPTGEP
eukprot:7390758-Heterocapsa_arctica.AAC.1